MELNLERSAWNRTVATAPMPSPRSGCSTAYDGTADSTLVVGGIDNTFLNEVWLLCLTPGRERWTQLQPISEPPSGRGDAAYCCEPIRRRLYVFGGLTYPPLRFHDDIHCLDLGANHWSKVNSAGPTPGARRRAAGLFDARTGNFVVFGGQDSTDRTTSPD